MSASPENFILTSEQYRDTLFAHSESERTYVFKIEKGEKVLVYFGSAHTNDSEDPIFDEIKAQFDLLKPDMVYIEGWRSVNDNKDKARAFFKDQSLEDLKTEGESHFALKLAIDAGIDFESPEPNFSEEINFLLEKGFSKKDIFYFYLYRDIDQYQRQNKNRNLDECKKYLEPYINRFRIDSGWESTEIDLYVEEIFSELDIDSEEYNRQVDPIPWEGKTQTAINEISRNSSNFRDKYIFERIKEGLKTHNRLFVVYGSAHAVKQEAALRVLIEEL